MARGMLIPRADGSLLAFGAHFAAVIGDQGSVATASVFVATGTTPPTDPGAWTFYTSTGRTTLDVTFDPSATFGTAWVSVFWANAKGDSGPASAPTHIELPAATPLPGAGGMKIAA